MFEWLFKRRKKRVQVSTVVVSRYSKQEKGQKVNYTDKMVDAMKAQGSFDYNSAKAFADANGLSVRSVIAKVRALELEYTPKASNAKSGSASKPAVRRKADVVTSINKALGLTLASLEKMTLKDLEALEAAVSA